MTPLVEGSVEILRAAVEEFGDHAFVTSSFQSQGIALLHLVAQHAPDLPVWFIDTGYHFPETLEYRDEVARALKLNLQVIRPSILTREEAQERRKVGRDDLCCRLLKVNVMASLLDGHVGGCWISGVRRDQTRARKSLEVREHTPQGVTRVHPMLEWTQKDVMDYAMRATDLRYHPLMYSGYESIGCAPCTTRGEGREGRWPGSPRDGCGIHQLIIRGGCQE